MTSDQRCVVVCEGYVCSSVCSSSGQVIPEKGVSTVFNNRLTGRNIF